MREDKIEIEVSEKDEVRFSEENGQKVLFIGDKIYRFDKIESFRNPVTRKTIITMRDARVVK